MPEKTSKLSGKDLPEDLTGFSFEVQYESSAPPEEHLLVGRNPKNPSEWVVWRENNGTAFSMPDQIIRQIEAPIYSLVQPEKQVKLSGKDLPEDITGYRVEVEVESGKTPEQMTFIARHPQQDSEWIIRREDQTTFSLPESFIRKYKNIYLPPDEAHLSASVPDRKTSSQLREIEL